jgi:hypothetical protein
VRGGIQNNGDIILREELWEKRMNMKEKGRKRKGEIKQVKRVKCM